MAAFTTTASIQYEIAEVNTFGINGRTTHHRTVALTQKDAEREHLQVHELSADLSAHEIPINPMGVCAASMAMLFLMTNKPVDIRFVNQSGDFLSAVRFALLAMTISNLYITTGSQATTVRTAITGGSNATFTITPPIPD